MTMIVSSQMKTYSPFSLFTSLYFYIIGSEIAISETNIVQKIFFLGTANW